ncbi:MAG: hypothetical protein AAFP90_04010 [Planctomycetota bacterium]
MGKRDQKRSENGRLRLERLENRQLLAADGDLFCTAEQPQDQGLDAALFAGESFAAPDPFIGPIQSDTLPLQGESDTTSSRPLVTQGEPAPDLVAFAQALDDAGVVFYGAEWCAACTRQKELFEDGARFLPFVEVTRG